MTRKSHMSWKISCWKPSPNYRLSVACTTSFLHLAIHLKGSRQSKNGLALLEAWCSLQDGTEITHTFRLVWSMAMGWDRRPSIMTRLSPMESSIIFTPDPSSTTSPTLDWRWSCNSCAPPRCAYIVNRYVPVEATGIIIYWRLRLVKDDRFSPKRPIAKQLPDANREKSTATLTHPKIFTSFQFSPSFSLWKMFPFFRLAIKEKAIRKKNPLEEGREPTYVVYSSD